MVILGEDRLALSLSLSLSIYIYIYIYIYICVCVSVWGDIVGFESVVVGCAALCEKEL